jgi:serine/threonine protein kinase
MEDMQLEPGTVLAEKYKLGSVLGVGGMGTVYLAEHLALKAPVAIKVIDREVGEGDVALTRFMREAQAAASLRSPHVVQILDYGMEGKRPFIVMEMLEGEALSDRIKRQGRLSPKETFRVISHVARAISKAHEADIIHRDLKPDNIFLVHNEGDEIAKVLDFGVAKVDATALDGSGHTRTGSLLGTPYYMSPEQAQGNKDIDSRSDLWALGVIAFECLTGIRPFSSDGLGDLVLQICIRDIPVPSEYGKLPEGFDAWFSKACEREPKDRFQSARELAEALKPALDIGRDRSDSVPESRWTQLVAQSPNEDGLFDKTTQPDPAPRGFSDPQGQVTALGENSVRTPSDLSSTRASESSEGAPEAALGSAPRSSQASQWEVLPHGHGREVSRQKSAALLALEEDEERPSSAGTILFVAIAALLVGGAIVFGFKQAGINFSNKPTSAIKARDLRDSKKTAPKVEKSPQVQESETLDLSPKPQGAVPLPGVKDGATTTEPSTERTLEAIETAASEAVKEREIKEAAEAESGGPKPVSDKSLKGTEGDPSTETPEGQTSNPEPKLPDNLAPAPEPPQEVKKPEAP